MRRMPAVCPQATFARLVRHTGEDAKDSVDSNIFTLGAPFSCSHTHHRAPGLAVQTNEMELLE